MTEIRTAVDLHHPTDRAWRALTDRRLLPQWFAATDLEARVGAQFQLAPADLPGMPGPIEGEVTELDEPHRIVMRWYEEERQSLVICDLRPNPEGCQLVVREYCEEGEWTPEERDLRQETYEQLLTGRLPAVLDWLAFREVDFPDEAADDDEVAAERAGGRTPGRRRMAAVLAVGLIGAGVAAGGGAWWLNSGEQAVTAPTTAPASEVSATATTRPTTAGPTHTPPSATATASATPTPSLPQRTNSAGVPVRAAALGGRYATLASRILGYTGEIVVSNTGNAGASSWTATIALPAGASVRDASGASYKQQGRTVTFTGPAIGAGGSGRVQFDVSGEASLGAQKPQSCTVDGRPCAGL